MLVASPPRTAIDINKQGRDRNTETAREAEDIEEPDVAFATLNATDVRAMQPGTVGKFLL
jgi:hypothetical protein